MKPSADSVHATMRFAFERFFYLTIICILIIAAFGVSIVYAIVSDIEAETRSQVVVQLCTLIPVFTGLITLFQSKMGEAMRGMVGEKLQADAAPTQQSEGESS